MTGGPYSKSLMLRQVDRRTGFMEAGSRQYTVVTAWRNETNRWRWPQPAGKQKRTGMVMTKLRLRVRRADTISISVDKTNQLRDLCPHPRRRPNTAGDARALTIVAALVRALRTLTRVASKFSSFPRSCYVNFSRR